MIPASLFPCTAKTSFLTDIARPTYRSHLHPRTAPSYRYPHRHGRPHTNRPLSIRPCRGRRQAGHPVTLPATSRSRRSNVSTTSHLQQENENEKYNNIMVNKFD